MTDYISDDASNVELALRAVAEGRADNAELDTLARSVFLIPTGAAPDDNQSPGIGTEGSRVFRTGV
ncbi:hypothetical protein WJ438_38175 [Streptomyces sp. GD-15H]|uniref:hypothetical protein n=1 Tax=Streptomyces sp. GD-15H TaxID=3129112 RepID=UPI00325321F0